MREHVGCIGSNGWEVRRAAHGEERARRDAQFIEKTRKLVLDDICERPNDQQRMRRVGGLVGKDRDQRGETCVFALREGRFDSTSRIAEDPCARRMYPRLPLGGALQVDLDDFRGAGAHEKQQLDLGAALQQAPNHPVQLVVDVGDSRQITLVQNGGGEARLGENHHARRRLNQMGAGARAHHQEEGVLNLAMQPDDAGEAAENLALAALLHHGGGGAARNGGDGAGAEGGQGVHWAASMAAPALVMASAALCSLAARSFRMNWAALTT